MRSKLAAIIFDHTVLLEDFENPLVLDELKKLLPWLKQQGLDLVVFSTHPRNIQADLKSKGLPPIDLFLTEREIGARKGSDKWVREAARHLGIQHHQFVYIGDDDRDWKSSVNAATCYIQAEWAGKLPERMSALSVHLPREIVKYLTHYLFPPPRWTYSLDDEERGLYFRSLLSAPLELPSSDPSSSFDLRDIFGKNREVSIGGESARNLLMLHALSSLYLEGLIRPRSLFAVYPSHTPGKISKPLRGYLNPAASFFGTYFKPDLLVRWTEAIDTSKERGAARREGRDANVSASDQTNSIHVNPARRRLLVGKNRNVVVFDDFANSGTSLDWARNLLYAAGADRVITVTIGKYGRTESGRAHRMLVPQDILQLHPYEPAMYDLESLFSVVPLAMRPDESAETIVRTSFEHLKERTNYPIHSL